MRRTTVMALALLLALATLGQSSQDAAPPPAASTPSAGASSAPVAAPSPAPVVVAAPIAASAASAPATLKAEPTVKRDIRLQYDHAPISTVVRSFSDKLKRPILGDYQMDGQITFFDSQPYSAEEAFETINILLAMRGCRMVEEGRYLRVLKLADLSSLPVRIYHGLAQTRALRDSELVTVLLPLKYLQPSEARQAVLPMVSAYGKLIELGKKGLLITDEMATIRRINTLLEVLDTAETGTDMQIKVVELKYAPAREVARVIGELWGQRSVQQPRPGKPQPGKPQPGKPKPQPQPQQVVLEPIKVNYDDRTNMVILMGEPGALLLAEEMIARLDREQGGPEGGDTRVFKLVNARANELARTLQQAVAGQDQRARRGGTMATRIVPDAATNRVVVSAPVDQMAKIESLIATLDGDQADVDAGGVRVFPLKVADARQLSMVIQVACNRPRGTPGRYEPGPTVSADPRSNSLIVAGSAGDLKTAAALVEELDRVRDEQALEVRVIHLETGDIYQIARSLSNVLNKEPGGGYGPMPSGGSGIRIEADRASGNLIVAAPPAEWPRIEKVLQDFKDATVTQTQAVTRLVPLQHASARDMARTLDQIYSRRDRSGWSRSDTTLPVVIAASEQANALLISASQDDQNRIAELIAQMDVEGGDVGARITMIELKAANAQQVAETLRAMLPRQQNWGQEPEVVISADTQTNSVLLRAPENQRKTLEDMIARLDKPVSASARETRVHPLGQASATAMATMLNQLYGRSDPRSPYRGRFGDPGAAEAERVTITAAPGDKALVIDAPRQKMDAIVQLIASLDAEGEVAGRLIPRSYALANARARELAHSLTRLFAERRPRFGPFGQATESGEPEPRFEAEDASNLLLVAATQSQYEIIDKLIQQMESDAADRQVQVRLFALSHAQSADIQQTVLTVLTTRAAGSSVPSWHPASGSTRITVNPDERTNALIVTAPAALMAEAETLIATLDTPEAAENAVTTEVVPLANADAEQVAAALNAALGGQDAPAGRRAGGMWGSVMRSNQAATSLRGRNVRVVAEPGARSLLLTGTSADIAVTKSLIAELDKRGDDGTPVTTPYRLAHARADEVARVLTETLGSPAGRGYAPRAGRGAGEVRVSADTASNTVVVAASPAMQEKVAALVERLDCPELAESSARVEVVPLAHGKAAAMAEALNAARGVGVRGRGQAAGPPPITAVDPGNALVLTGRPEELAEMKALIRQLDEAGAKLTAETRFFPLQHARAKDVVDVLQTMLAEAAATSSQRPPRGYQSSGAAEVQVRVAAQDQTNSLIVQGPPDRLALAEQMIAQLDVPEADLRVVIEIVRLTNAQAASLAEAINNMLAGQQASEQGRGQSDEPTAADVVTVTPESNSNSVLVRGSAARVPEVVAMIRQLDGTGVSSAAQLRTYRLANNDAEELATSLGKLFTDMIKQMPGKSGESEGAAATPFSIAADLRTNSLVVSTTPAYFSMFEQLLSELEDTQVPLREVYYIPLANADAYDLSLTLENLFAGRKGLDAPIIEPDYYANALTIIAKEIDYRRMLPLIDKIDKVQSIKVQVIAVTGLKAEELATQLQRVYPQLNPESQLRVVEQLPGRAEPGPATPAVPAEPASPTPASGPAVPAVLRADDTHAQLPPPPTAAGVKPPVLIAVDKRTNSLIVSATQQEIDAIKALASQLSRGADLVDAQIRWFPLTQADPQAVAATLDKLFNPQVQAPPPPQPKQQGQGGKDGADKDKERPQPPAQPVPVPQKIVVVPEPRTRHVIVRAKPADLDLIEPVVAQLDQPRRVKTEVRTFPLVNTDATEVASNLRELFRLSGRRGAPGASGTPQEARAEAIRVMMAFQDAEGNALDVDSLATTAITANRATNSVVVSAPPEAMAVVESVIQELDQSAGQSNRPVIRLYPITVEDVAGLAATVTKVFAGAETPERAARRAANAAGPPETPVVITPDEAGRLLVVSASPEQHERIAAVIKDIQSAQSGEGLVTRIVQLHRTKAADLAKALSQVAESSPGARADGGRGARPAVTIAPEPGSNAIILSGPVIAVERYEKIVAQIEQMNPKRGSGVPRIIQLENVNPTELEQAIRKLYGGSSSSGSGDSRGGPGGQGTLPFEMTVLPGQRQLLVDADDEDLKTIQDLVAALEEAARTQKPEIRLFELQYADSTRVAESLRQVFANIARQGRPEDLVNVTALPKTKAVMVAAAPDKMVDAERIIKQLDTATISPTMDFRVWPLTYAEPTQAVSLLNKMLDEYRKQRPDEPISVAVDERTRSLIVSARAEMFEQIDKLIGRIDVRPPFPVGEVMVVPLRQADAPTLAGVLNEMLQPGKTGQVTPEARALQEQVKLLQVRGADGEVLPELDLTKPIKIQADPVVGGQQGSNALVITSTADNLKALAAVIRLMDTVPVSEAVKVRLVVLRNADAAAVKKVLDEVFSQGAKQLAGKPGSSVAGKAEPREGEGKALVKPLTVAVDARTNAVVLSGAPETVELAERIAGDLDRDSGKFVTEVRLFKLLHADAVRLSPLLQGVFGETAGAADAAEGVRTHVTRLVRKLVDGKVIGSEYPKSRPGLSIQADATTNTLVVAARGDVMPIIADVVASMDIPGAGSMNSVRIFPLTHADASRLQGVIDGLYTGPNAAMVRAEDRPTIQVDTRTNALIISASDKTFALVAALLEKLDAPTAVGLHEVRQVAVANADAESLAGTIQKLMDARVQRQKDLGAKDAEALRVLIVADARSNSLIVAGAPESYELVKGLAERLDGARAALSGQIQVIPLVNANASALATTLTSLFDQRYQAARTQDVQRQKPVILPDPRTNSLLVAANQDDSQVLHKLLAKLDVKPTDPSVQLVVIPLEHNDAGIVGPMIKRLFDARVKSMSVPGQTANPQDQVDVETDALANSMIVSASRENLALIRALLAKVDVEPPTETGVVRLYALEHADATRVASMLDSLVGKGLYKPGMAVAGQGDNAALTAREKVAIVADERTNVLIVSASKENFAVLEEVIGRIDTADAEGLMGDIRMYALQRANADRLAPTLQKFFDAKRQAEVDAADTQGKGPLAVTFIADTRTNTLLVAGGKELFTAVETMIAKLDGETVLPSAVFRVFRLRNASAATMAEQVEKLFAGRPKPTEGELDPVTVVPDKKANALVVGATTEDMLAVEDLVSRMDQEVPSDLTQRVLALRKADAGQVVETITKLYENQGGLSEVGVDLSVDKRTNSVIVSAGTGEIDRIEGLVKQIDGDKLTHVTEIRVLPLRNADATELAELLTKTLTSKPASPAGQDSNRQTLLQFIRNLPGGQRLVSQALQEGVLITPDKRSNALVVTAPVEELELLRNLVEALDAVPPRAAQIKAFVLVNADASQMATMLKELFRLEGGSTGGATSAPTAVSYTLSTGKGPNTAATIGSAADAALTITVDTRTNTLLVGGTDQYVKLATRVIEELDAHPAQERVSRIYRLRNVQAVEIEAAMRKWLDEERQRLTDALGTDNLGAMQRLLEQEVSVVAVATSTDVGNASSTAPSMTGTRGNRPSPSLQAAGTTSNTLLISACPRYFDTIVNMIEQLDEPPPQVLIDVLLAEIVLDDTVNLGAEWAIESTFDGDKVIGTGTDFGIEGAISRTGSGFNLSVSGGDLNLFIRALQSQGRLRVLNRPQILAIDNQASRIQSGQDVPVPTYSYIVDGTVQNNYRYEPVGVILEVIPRISPDGFVRMEVHPEISSLSISSVQIGEDVNAQIINRRSATTTITVKDGHSIVVGGLISTKDEVRENKVPLLGDIPVLGWLFRSDTVVKERTELLIILTPRIIRSVREADLSTDLEVRRMQTLSPDGCEPLLNSLLDPLHSGPVIRPDGVHWRDDRSSCPPVRVNGTLTPTSHPIDDLR